MCGVTMNDRETNEELRKLVVIEPSATVIRSGRPKWYGHVMRKSDRGLGEKMYGA